MGVPDAEANACPHDAPKWAIGATGALLFLTTGGCVAALATADVDTDGASSRTARGTDDHRGANNHDHRGGDHDDNRGASDHDNYGARRAERART